MAAADYRKPVFFLPEVRWLDARLVNARDITYLPNHPKTGKSDVVGWARPLNAR